ncbi:MAG: DUF1549 domain-containing protein, partial [Pedosphaera sp.]|nr:DUF1549 domain-containing protein [Pedosphaera sp.]
MTASDKATTGILHQRSMALPIIITAFVAICFGATVSAAEAPLRQTIDAQVQGAWKKDNIPSATTADDATFLRRVFLDLVGTIPTHDEAR